MPPIDTSPKGLYRGILESHQGPLRRLLQSQVTRNNQRDRQDAKAPSCRRGHALPLKGLSPFSHPRVTKGLSPFESLGEVKKQQQQRERDRLQASLVRAAPRPLRNASFVKLARSAA